MKENFKVKVQIKPYTLDFKFEAGTSRGVLKEKETFIIHVFADAFPGISGFGEAGPLRGLSLDDHTDFIPKTKPIIQKVENLSFSLDRQKILQAIRELPQIDRFPSLRFGLETALLDLIHGGRKKIFSCDFYDHQKPVPINGLIWMGDKDFMKRQIDQKLREGFNCIKMKIGAMDFDLECNLLEMVRNRYSEHDVSLRVDANGAFGLDEAMEKLNQLSQFGVHSIEQPIKPGNTAEMAYLCKHSPVPIALDEELIAVSNVKDKEALIEQVKPSYLILKPSLLGGIMATEEWISIAGNSGTGWWMTSALESNIGLNAIAQFASSLQTDLPQGLGTGQLYHNNFPSPLGITNGHLSYDTQKPWSIPKLFGLDAD
ncbi:o-succinylbenzoate synthase [Cyclobacterium plantarum]|uniref:o-succinylbenzoate synthase n=1 Tax=Cyclobacterium plantarum TaxID=2716263 RepID=UPI003F6F0794